MQKKQATFEFEKINGIIVGFRCPEFVKGVNVPGDHLHFLSEKKDSGGHILDFIVENATVSIDYTSGFYLALPDEESGFYGIDLTKDKSEELEKVEK